MHAHTCVHTNIHTTGKAKKVGSHPNTGKIHKKCWNMREHEFIG